LTDALIYKIESADVWSAAQEAGCYDGSDVDRADGFIHFSTARQAAATLAKWFHGRKRLIVAAVEAASLGAALRYEPARGGDLFPHLYAPLPMSAVRWSRPIADRADGGHDLGALDP
jgi:uncharacterized protein (DUF952 family)